MKYNKLVRDNIPAIILENGEFPTVHRLVRSVPDPPLRLVGDTRKIAVCFVLSDADLQSACRAGADIVAEERLLGAVFTSPKKEISLKVMRSGGLWDEAFPHESMEWYYLYWVTKWEFLDRLRLVFGRVEEINSHP